MPEVYKELDKIQKYLEKHYRNMLDIEFTIQEGKFICFNAVSVKETDLLPLKWLLICLKKNLSQKKKQLLRVEPNQLDELLHPIIDPAAEKEFKPFAKGLPAGPGGATGQIVFTSQ